MASVAVQHAQRCGLASREGGAETKNALINKERLQVYRMSKVCMHALVVFGLR